MDKFNKLLLSKMLRILLIYIPNFYSREYCIQNMYLNTFTKSTYLNENTNTFKYFSIYQPKKTLFKKKFESR